MLHLFCVVKYWKMWILKNICRRWISDSFARNLSSLTDGKIVARRLLSNISCTPNYSQKCIEKYRRMRWVVAYIFHYFFLWKILILTLTFRKFSATSNHNIPPIIASYILAEGLQVLPVLFHCLINIVVANNSNIRPLLYGIHNCFFVRVVFFFFTLS